MENDEIRIPKGCTLVHNPARTNGFDGKKIPRITAEQVAMVVNCIVRDDGPKKLNLLSTTGMIGERGDEYVEFTADGYQLAAFVRGGVVSNVFYCLTPKGGEYFMPLDGGSPFDDVTIGDRTALTIMLVESVKKKSCIEVVPCWIVAINGARPYASHLFYTEQEALDARDEQQAHYERYSKGASEIKESQSTEKKKAKEASTIAFRAKSKGITKKK